MELSIEPLIVFLIESLMALLIAVLLCLSPTNTIKPRLMTAHKHAQHYRSRRLMLD